LSAIRNGLVGYSQRGGGNYPRLSAWRHAGILILNFAALAVIYFYRTPKKQKI
jgi:hypothetical protein